MRASTDAAIRRSARYGSFIPSTKSKRRSARNRSSLLFLHFKEERACHPERSARNARGAKDLLLTRGARA